MKRLATTPTFFVYLFDASAPRKQELARELIRREGPRGSLVLSTQVLQELYVTVTRKLRPLARWLPFTVWSRAVETGTAFVFAPGDVGSHAQTSRRGISRPGKSPERTSASPVSLDSRRYASPSSWYVSKVCSPGSTIQ